MRNLPGVSAERVVLIGLGKQDAYKASVHADAERTFANYCAKASLREGVSTLAAIECPDSTLSSRAKALAMAAGDATYHYDATLSKKDENPAPKLKKLSLWAGGVQPEEANAGLREGQAIANGMALTPCWETCRQHLHTHLSGRHGKAIGRAVQQPAGRGAQPKRN